MCLQDYGLNNYSLKKQTQLEITQNEQGLRYERNEEKLVKNLNTNISCPFCPNSRLFQEKVKIVPLQKGIPNLAYALSGVSMVLDLATAYG